MANDVELQGVIKLTADTTEAEKKVDSVGTSKPAAGGLDKDVAKAKDTAEKAAKEVLGKITSLINSVFGQFGQAATGAFGKFAGILGNVGSLFGGGSKAAAAVAGGAGAAAAGGGAAAGGVGAGAAGAAVAGGPVGIGIAVAAGLVAAGMAVATVFKEVVDRVLSFARTLAEVSPSMAVTFAMFDRQIMMIKNQLGEELAPGIRQLLDSIMGLIDEILPPFAAFVQGVIAIVTIITNAVHAMMLVFNVIMDLWGIVMNLLLGNGASGKKNSELAMNIADSYIKGKQIKNPMDVITDAIKDWHNAWDKENARRSTGMVMTDFMKRINADGSAQRQYQDQFRQHGPGGAAVAVPARNAGGMP